MSQNSRLRFDSIAFGKIAGELGKIAGAFRPMQADLE
jgi:hypothetical protein